MKFGLKEATITQINQVFKNHADIDRAVLYGSRAKGNYKPGSDIDLTLYGDGLSYELLGKLLDELDDVLLPYTFDLSIFEKIDNPNLRDHIERVGLDFYEREVSGKQGWEVKKLGEICEFNPPKKEAREKLKARDLVTFLPMEDLGIFNKKIVPLKQKQLHEVINGYTYFSDNDVIMAKITPCFENGKLGIARNLINGIGFGSSEYIVFRLHGNVEPDYIYYFLSQKNIRDEGKKLMTGSVGHKRVSKDWIENYIISYPKSLPEQHRIVTILDQAFAAIEKAKANTEKNLQNAKALFESYLQNIFETKEDGWEEKTLGEIAFVKSGGTPSRAKVEYWDGNIAWYSSGELNNLYTVKPERHINNLAINNSNAKLFPRGSLLIGMYDTAALKMSILDREATFNQAIAGVEPNKKVNLLFVLHSINAIKPDLLNLRRGVRQKNLSLEKIKEIPIFFPPLAEQTRIVKKLDALSAETKKLEALYQKKIADLEELKKSILNKAFNGELHPHPNPPPRVRRGGDKNST